MASNLVSSPPPTPEHLLETVTFTQSQGPTPWQRGALRICFLASDRVAAMLTPAVVQLWLPCPAGRPPGQLQGMRPSSPSRTLRSRSRHRPREGGPKIAQCPRNLWTSPVPHQQVWACPCSTTSPGDAALKETSLPLPCHMVPVRCHTTSLPRRGARPHVQPASPPGSPSVGPCLGPRRHLPRPGTRPSPRTSPDSLSATGTLTPSVLGHSAGGWDET